MDAWYSVVHPTSRPRRPFIMQCEWRQNSAPTVAEITTTNAAQLSPIVYIRHCSTAVRSTRGMAYECQAAASKHVHVWQWYGCVHGRRKPFSRSATNTLILSFGCRRRRRCCRCRWHYFCIFLMSVCPYSGASVLSSANVVLTAYVECGRKILSPACVKYFGHRF